MAMMSSPADDDGRTPPKDMQTPNNRPKIFLKFVVIVLQIITYFSHPMYKTYDKMPYDNFLYFWFFTIYKKLTKENDWKMDPQTCYFKSWWARLFAILSIFLKIYVRMRFEIGLNPIAPQSSMLWVRTTTLNLVI